MNPSTTTNIPTNLPVVFPCPSCGHCPTCGRGGAGYPVYPYPTAWPPYNPFIVWNTTYSGTASSGMTS